MLSEKESAWIEQSKIVARLNTTETLRQLAELYEEAAECTRSQILINRAVEVCDRVSAQGQGKVDIDITFVSRVQAMVLLDAAIIYAQAGRLSEAKAFADRSIMLCKTAPAEDSDINREDFAKSYSLKFLKLAKELAQKTHGNELAIKYLLLGKKLYESTPTITQLLCIDR